MPALRIKPILLFACIWMITLISASTGASGQAWVQKMFKQTSHDFGDVQLGETPEHRFEIENVFNETLRIRSVTSSCGCTIASATKNVLKTWEKAQIICKFNSPAVGVGSKQATVSVRFDRPYVGEMQLTVNGNIVTGISLSPKMVEFGQVAENNLPVRKVKLTSSGNPSFRVHDVKSVFKHIKVEIRETARQSGMVSYEIMTQLKDSVPKGFNQDQLYLVLQEGQNPDGTARLRQVSLPFTAKVTSALQVSPEIWTVGPLAAGETASKKVYLKSDKPFQVRDVRCQSKAFSVKANSKVKKFHIVDVTYTEPSEPGQRECELSFFVEYPGSATATTSQGQVQATAKLKAIIQFADDGRDKVTTN